MLIDFHMHLFPDAIAPRALCRLSATSGLAPVTDGTVRGTVKKMDEWGVDGAVVLHIATSPRQQANVNAFAAAVNKSENGRLYSFGSVHPDSPDALEELGRLRAAGLRGVKLHPDYQGFDADERRLYALYEEIARLSLVLVFHAGLDPLSPDHVHCTPAMLARVLRDFPTLRVVCAHMGGLRMWDEVETELIGRQVWLDTSFCAGLLSARQARRLISRHGAERILFGSDCPWQDSATAFHFIDALGLSGRETECIYSANARALLDI